MLQTLGKTFQFLRKLNIHLPRDPEVPTEDIYQGGGEIHLHKIFTPMFTEALCVNSQKVETASLPPMWRIGK